MTKKSLISKITAEGAPAARQGNLFFGGLFIMKNNFLQVDFELAKQNYNLRVAKDTEIIRIFVDNKPVCEITEKLGASHVGWRTGNTDYITLFHAKR